MITLASEFPAAFEERELELKPVAVTRWTARLADPVYERSFLDSRFPVTAAACWCCSASLSPPAY